MLSAFTLSWISQQSSAVSVLGAANFSKTMGQQLSQLPAVSFPSMGGNDPSMRVIVDFEHAPPPADPGVVEALKTAEEALAQLASYEPQPAPIREAISKPSDAEVSLKTAIALTPNINIIAGWYNFSTVISKQLAAVADHLASNTPRAGLGGTTIADLPAETTALASLLHFCWKFDQGKMMQPGVQNDFAGYRRVVGKVEIGSVPGQTVDEAASGTISMWVADMSPFTAKVVGAVSSATKRTLLAAVAHACWASVSQAGSGPAAVASGGGFGGPAPAVGSIQWLLEVMVAALVLYDRASFGQSVFDSKEVQIKKCVMAVKKCGGPGKDALLNSLKYSTLHFNDAPPAVAKLFE